MRLLLSHAVLAGILAGSLAAAFTSIPASAASVIHPGLESKLTQLRPEDPVSVIVYLEEAPIPEVSASLSAGAASRGLRNQIIIETLQEQQQRTQASLKHWLDQGLREGSVLGYTSYWVTNCVVVHARTEAVLAIAERADVERIEANFRVELVEPIFREEENQGELSGPGQRGIAEGNWVTPGVRACRADLVWYEYGFTGAGRVIATIDTGVQGEHPAFSDSWRGVNHPVSECWLDVLGISPDFPFDDFGHGTHVNGIMVGNSPTTLDTVGVAWGSTWIATNAVDQDAAPEFDNDAIESFQFLMNPDGDPMTSDDVPDVINNSWGINEDDFGFDYEDCDSRWWSAMDNCEAAGIVVIFAAGNEGPNAQTMRSPADRGATATNAFSVGAVEASFSEFPYPIADFSSRGPSGCDVSPELRIKPELVAPGVSVYSAYTDGSYTTAFSGTSMSAPHVSGVVALLREADPHLEVDEIKQILLDTGRAIGIGDNNNTYGHGMVDAYAALQEVISDFGTLDGYVANASFGNAPVPGATITVIEAERILNGDGDGNYTGIISPGTYMAEASHPSFESQVLPVTIDPNGSTTLDFSLVDAAGPTIENVFNPVSTFETGGTYVIEADIYDASSVVSALLFYRVDEGPWTSVPMTGAERFSGNIPGQVAGSSIDFYIWAEDGAGFTRTEPQDAPSSYYTFRISLLAYAYDAETPDENWQLGVPEDQATTGIWVRDDPVGTIDLGETVQMEDDTTPDPGVNCFVTGNGKPGGASGDNDVDNGCTTLVSPVIDCGGGAEAVVRYNRWFMMAGASEDDIFAIEVSNDAGATWHPLETLSFYEAAWRSALIEISSILPLTSQMQFRWIACDINSPGLTECGVDDFSVEVFIPNAAHTPDDVGPAVAVSEVGHAPNPMRESTTVRFRLSNHADANLTIYDASGRAVRSLVQQSLNPGIHEVPWDGTDDRGNQLGTGVYFYRLKAGAFEQSRRIQLIH